MDLVLPLLRRFHVLRRSDLFPAAVHLSLLVLWRALREAEHLVKVGSGYFPAFVFRFPGRPASWGCFLRELLPALVSCRWQYAHSHSCALSSAAHSSCPIFGERLHQAAIIFSCTCS